MKAGLIVDAAIESSEHSLVVELPNGTRLQAADYSFSTNKRGEPVLVIKAGKKLTKTHY